MRPLMIVRSFLHSDVVCLQHKSYLKSMKLNLYSLLEKKRCSWFELTESVPSNEGLPAEHILYVYVCVKHHTSLSLHVVSSEASDVLVRIEVTSCTDGIASVTPRQWITKTSGRAQGHHIQRSKVAGMGGR